MQASVWQRLFILTLWEVFRPPQLSWTSVDLPIYKYKNIIFILPFQADGKDVTGGYWTQRTLQNRGSFLPLSCWDFGGLSVPVPGVHPAAGLVCREGGQRGCEVSSSPCHRGGLSPGAHGPAVPSRLLPLTPCGILTERTNPPRGQGRRRRWLGLSAGGGFKAPSPGPPVGSVRSDPTRQERLQSPPAPPWAAPAAPAAAPRSRRRRRVSGAGGPGGGTPLGSLGKRRRAACRVVLSAPVSGKVLILCSTLPV